MGKKTIAKILACIAAALAVIALLVFRSGIPPKDDIQPGRLPEKFSIDTTGNYIDFQSGNECSAYASAYVLRHMGEQVEGSALYDDIQRVFGFVPTGSVVRLFQQYGYTAAACHGTIETMKQRLVSGIPVIAFVSIPGDTHYTVVVGYDEHFIYLADSISEDPDAEIGWYSRKLSTEEFMENWKTNRYPVDNIYIVISPS